jgi:hypothetical protein
VSVQSTLSALTLGNTNYSSALKVSQYGSNTGYNVAEFNDSTGRLLTVTNSATIAAFYTDPTTAPAKFSINGPTYIAGATTINNSLCATQNVVLGTGLRLYTGVADSENYEILTTNTNLTSITDTGFNILSTFSVFFRPKVQYSTPVRVHNTRFEVSVGDIFNVPTPNNGAYFIVDPLSAYGNSQGVTVHGTLSSLSSLSVSYYDGTGMQLLSTRRASPLKVSLVNTSSASDLVTQFNALLDALTAHGLIR